MNSLMPLGDQAALVYLSDETAALRYAAGVRGANLPWLIDVVQAYTSVAVFFDLNQVAFGEVAARLRRIDIQDGKARLTGEGRPHRIPCCYELGPDLGRIAEQAQLTVEEVIRLHGEALYTVYAIGFCPGFPYLGYLPDKLCGIPRLEKPRVRVEAGSVGLTGRQTGIYTEERPGGWNLIGRTPLELVNVREEYFPLRTGDRVQFQRVDRAEFERLRGKRLDG